MKERKGEKGGREEREKKREEREGGSELERSEKLSCLPIASPISSVVKLTRSSVPSSAPMTAMVSVANSLSSRPW